MRQILAAVALTALGSLVSVASPAQAASGPWSVASAGGFHTCAISTGKSLYCWGDNLYGQLGDGTTADQSSPENIATSGVWASLSTGALHTCAISTGKSLYCWGYNSDGQVGDGTTASPRVSPKKIGASGVWASVSAGREHTCAVTTGESLYCWGGNDNGQIGDGTTTDRLSPKKVGSSGVWVGIAAGDSHTCAISTGKSLYCWGYNLTGAIGDGTYAQRLSPKKIGSTGVWDRINPGDFHTCAITTGNSLYCWGLNSAGQVGDGTTTSPRNSPKTIGASGVWARVDAGGINGRGHTCAVTTGKSLYCWGRNDDGQVGDGTTTSPRTSPKKIGASGVWAGASMGGIHTCAVTTGKSLYCWGYNSDGQVGDGTTTRRLSPKKIP